MCSLSSLYLIEPLKMLIIMLVGLLVEVRKRKKNKFIFLAPNHSKWPDLIFLHLPFILVTFGESG